MNENNNIIPYRSTNDTPAHIEADLFMSGNMLYADIYALYSTNGAQTMVVVGQTHRFPPLDYTEGKGINATFSRITSFAQINTSQVLVADSQRGCIRLLDRNTNQTQQFVGICKKTSCDTPQANKNISHSRFGEISGFVYHHQQQVIYIFEQGYHKRITKADLKANQVSTIAAKADFERDYHNPQYGVVDEHRGVVYVSVTYGIAKIDVMDNSFTYLNHQDHSGYKDGVLALSEFYWSMGMAMLGNDTLVVADANNNKLRVVDIPFSNVTNWCFNNTMDRDRSCFLRRPVSLHILNCDAYIGLSRLIAKLRLPETLCSDKNVTISQKDSKGSREQI